MLPATEKLGSVVVCEDDELTREMLCHNLLADRFDPAPAGTAEAALRICRYEGPDALLLDLDLPDASGLDVLREIRGAEYAADLDPALPVIVLSGFAAPGERVRGLSEGADDYLVKPFHYQTHRPPRSRRRPRPPDIKTSETSVHTVALPLGGGRKRPPASSRRRCPDLLRPSERGRPARHGFAVRVAADLMLSIGKLVADQEAYYDQQVAQGRDDYYKGKGEARGEWSGSAAGELGLEGEVDSDAFAQLIAGIDPRSGDPLRDNKVSSKVAAFDLTFSAPKSVSVLYALADPSTSQAMLESHRAAVREAMAYLEEEACRVRRGAGGARTLEGSGSSAPATGIG